jgi:hypothetical protein
MRSNVSLSDGRRNLQTILSQLGDKDIDWNEANTRVHIVDRLLTECLGWSKEPEQFDVERYSNGEYLDYVLGAPAVVIWEAKRTGIYFDVPADADNRIVN